MPRDLTPGFSLKKIIKKVVRPGSLSKEELEEIKNARIAHEASVQAAQQAQIEKHIVPHSEQEEIEKMIKEEEKRKKKFARD